MATDPPSPFLTALDERRRAEVLALVDLPGRVAAALEQGRAAWPEVSLDGAVFLRRLAASLVADPADAPAWLASLKADDLYLACACGERLPAALRAFESRYGGELDAVARRFASASISAGDLRQILLKKLFVAEGDAPARIAAYTGRGALQTWLRVTAVRAFIDVQRAEAHPEEIAASSRIDAAPQPGADPELDVLKAEHAVHFKAALGEALAGLRDGDRHLLRQYFVAGLSIDQLALVLHIHRATAARRVAKARQSMLRATRAALMRRLKLERGELDSLMSLVRSRLGPSIAGLFDS